MSEYIYGTDGHEGHWLTGEEIVRCRDCKHLMSNNRCNLQDDYNEFHWLDVEPDGFCAWSERRDTDNASD